MAIAGEVTNEEVLLNHRADHASESTLILSQHWVTAGGRYRAVQYDVTEREQRGGMLRQTGR